MAYKFPCYQIFKDRSGGFYWVYYAANGEELARSSESYARKEGCQHCIYLLATSAQSPVYDNT